MFKQTPIDNAAPSAQGITIMPIASSGFGHSVSVTITSAKRS